MEDRPTYQKRISDFKSGVLDIAIKEVNKYMELDVWYKEQKEGRSTFISFFFTSTFTKNALKEWILCFLSGT